jgi:hypothetical protein
LVTQSARVTLASFGQFYDALGKDFAGDLRAMFA